MAFNGKLFDIDDEVFQVIEDGLSDIAEAFGKQCTLFYPPGWAAYTDTQSPVAGGRGRDQWVTGGPADGWTAPSTTPVVATHPTEVVKLLIAWVDKDYWIRPAVNTVSPSGAIQTKGFMADLEKVMKCEYMMVQSAVNDRLRLKFERDGAPVDQSNIIQDAYFICNWKRVP